MPSSHNLGLKAGMRGRRRQRRTDVVTFSSWRLTGQARPLGSPFSSAAISLSVSERFILAGGASAEGHCKHWRRGPAFLHSTQKSLGSMDGKRGKSRLGRPRSPGRGQRSSWTENLPGILGPHGGEGNLDQGCFMTILGVSYYPSISLGRV